MRLYSTLCWMLLLCVTASGQMTSLSGRIVDRETGESLTGATIQSGDRVAVSAPDGQFHLAVMAGSHQFIVQYVGYEQQQLTLDIPGTGLDSVEIALTVSALILETATVTSGRYERSLAEATVSLEVLKPQFIDHLNTVTLDEALDRLPGVNIIDGQANIRGGSGYSYGAGSRVMLLVDDIPALQADAGFPNWSDLATESIEQVEVVKGAGSALYGSAALNGVINVRTAFAKSQPYTRFSSWYTAFGRPSERIRQWWDHSPGSAGLSLVHREKVGRWDFSGSLFYVNTDGYVRDAYNEQGRFTLSTRYRITDRLVVGLNTNINKGRSQSFFIWQDDQAGAYVGSGETNNSKSEKLRFWIDPYLTYYDRAGNRHKLTGRLYAIDNQQNLDQSNQSQLGFGEYQFQRFLAGPELVVTAGVLASGSRIKAELYNDTIFRSRNLAGYLQLEKTLFDRVTLSGGVRLEHNAILGPEVVAGDTIPDGIDAETKPILRLGTNTRIGKAGFLRASWGQGYRFPTIAEKYINTVFGGFQVVPNPRLQSETGWNAEIGFKQGIQVGLWNGFIDVAGFWTEYQNMMEFAAVVLPTFQSQNIGSTIIRGVEIGLQGQGQIWGRTTTLMAGYTYIDPRYATFGEAEQNSSSVDYNILKYRFNHSVKFDLEMPVTSWFTAGYTMQYNSHMEAIDGIFNLIPGVFPFREENDRGFTVMDLRLGVHPHSRVDVWVIAKNVLNEAYTLRPAQMEEPRNITVKLNVDLSRSDKI